MWRVEGKGLLEIWAKRWQVEVKRSELEAVLAQILAQIHGPRRLLTRVISQPL